MNVGVVLDTLVVDATVVGNHVQAIASSRAEVGILCTAKTHTALPSRVANESGLLAQLRNTGKLVDALWVQTKLGI